MANALYLQEGDSGTTVSLITGTLKLRMGTWQMSTPDPVGEWKEQSYGPAYSFRSYGRLIETFDLVAKDTAANIRTGVKAIEDMLEKARLWHTRKMLKNPIWLVMQGEGESLRRSLVYGGALRFSGIGGSSPLLEGSAVNAQLTLQRHPLWENTSWTTYNSGVVQMLGGIHSPSSSNVGTAPGRIRQMTVGENTGKAAKLWVGIRDYDEGPPDKLLWEIEHGTMNDTTYTGTGSESGASPYGSSLYNKRTVIYSAADTANIKRITITVLQGLNGYLNYAGMVGRYLVLMRAKVPSGTTVVFQLRAGYYGETDAAHRIVNTVYYAGTGSAYRLIELGKFSIPISRYDGGTNEIETTELQLWMQRVGGTGNVDLDAFVLIPAEHMVCIDTSTATIPYTTYWINVFPDEQVIVKSSIPTVMSIPVFSSQDFYWPTKGTVIGVAAERLAGSILNDSVTVVSYVYPRWLSYRV